MDAHFARSPPAALALISNRLLRKRHARPWRPPTRRVPFNHYAIVRWTRRHKCPGDFNLCVGRSRILSTSIASHVHHSPFSVRPCDTVVSSHRTLTRPNIDSAQSVSSMSAPRQTHRQRHISFTIDCTSSSGCLHRPVPLIARTNGKTGKKRVFSPLPRLCKAIWCSLYATPDPLTAVHYPVCLTSPR